MTFLGTTRQGTTAYHLHSNDMVERFHRRLKETIGALPHPTNWVDALRIILLTLRAIKKEDIHHTPVELLYGEDLCLPCQFVPPVDGGHSLSYLSALRYAMSSLRPTPPRPASSRPTHFLDELRTATAVFLRTGAHTGLLQPLYTGPFQVLSRGDKHVTRCWGLPLRRSMGQSQGHSALTWPLCSSSTLSTASSSTCTHTCGATRATSTSSTPRRRRPGFPTTP